MAIYSTFFLSNTEELPTGFPGWKLPLPDPVIRKSINPFTRKEITITTRAPDWDDSDPDEMEMPKRQVVAMQGDYATYLEQRLPRFVQSRPHWCAKNLTSVELEPLVAAAMDMDAITLETALYAHPSLGTAIKQIPDAFIACMATANDSSLNALAEEWSARMSTPEHTHSVGGERLHDDWAVDDALHILKPVVELARQQLDGQSMYFLIEG